MRVIFMFFHRFSHNFCSVGGKFFTLRSYVSTFFRFFFAFDEENFPRWTRKASRRERTAGGGQKINITINLQPPTAQFIFPPHHFAVFSIFSASPSLDGSSRRKRESSLPCFLLPFEGICFLTAADDVPPFSTPALATPELSALDKWDLGEKKKNYEKLN